MIFNLTVFKLIIELVGHPVKTMYTLNIVGYEPNEYRNTFSILITKFSLKTFVISTK